MKSRLIGRSDYERGLFPTHPPLHGRSRDLYPPSLPRSFGLDSRSTGRHCQAGLVINGPRQWKLRQFHPPSAGRYDAIVSHLRQRFLTASLATSTPPLVLLPGCHEPHKRAPNNANSVLPKYVTGFSQYFDPPFHIFQVASDARASHVAATQDRCIFLRFIFSPPRRYHLISAFYSAIQEKGSPRPLSPSSSPRALTTLEPSSTPTVHFRKTHGASNSSNVVVYAESSPWIATSDETGLRRPRPEKGVFTFSITPSPVLPLRSANTLI